MCLHLVNRNLSNSQAQAKPYGPSRQAGNDILGFETLLRSISLVS